MMTIAIKLSPKQKENKPIIPIGPRPTKYPPTIAPMMFPIAISDCINPISRPRCSVLVTSLIRPKAADAKHEALRPKTIIIKTTMI